MMFAHAWFFHEAKQVRIKVNGARAPRWRTQPCWIGGIFGNFFPLEVNSEGICKWILEEFTFSGRKFGGNFNFCLEVNFRRISVSELNFLGFLENFFVKEVNLPRILRKYSLWMLFWAF
uniref:Uncharacterized protein n=1 Tax=Cacopsylla melanoneura TaxID=428564 RepID=A0A8D8LRR4_9HEMI